MTVRRENPNIECIFHKGQYLVCPICEGAKGGRKTAQKHRGEHAKWGKLGGRPKKKKRS